MTLTPEYTKAVERLPAPTAIIANHYDLTTEKGRTYPICG
jgi:hypothetical protein